MINKNFSLKTFVQPDKKFNGKFTTLVGDNIYTTFDNKILKISIKYS